MLGKGKVLIVIQIGRLFIHALAKVVVLFHEVHQDVFW